MNRSGCWRRPRLRERRRREPGPRRWQQPSARQPAQVSQAASPRLGRLRKARPSQAWVRPQRGAPQPWLLVRAGRAPGPLASACLRPRAWLPDFRPPRFPFRQRKASRRAAPARPGATPVRRSGSRVCSGGVRQRRGAGALRRRSRLRQRWCRRRTGRAAPRARSRREQARGSARRGRAELRAWCSAGACGPRRGGRRSRIPHRSEWRHRRRHRAGDARPWAGRRGRGPAPRSRHR